MRETGRVDSRHEQIQRLGLFVVMSALTILRRFEVCYCAFRVLIITKLNIKKFTHLFSLSLAVCTAGCASLAGSSDEPFSGVRSDYNYFSEKSSYVGKSCAAMDLPWSTAMDLLFWPIEYTSVRQVKSGLWRDEGDGIEYRFVSYDPHSWPNIVINGDWDSGDARRIIAVKYNKAYINKIEFLPSKEGYALLSLPNHLSRIQLVPGDVVSNNLSVAAAPTPQLVQRIVKLREQLER